MEIVSIIWAMVLLFLPGTVVANRLNFTHTLERLAFTIIFSLTLFGLFAYIFSLIVPISSIFFIAYFFAFFVYWFYSQKNSFSFSKSFSQIKYFFNKLSELPKIDVVIPLFLLLFFAYWLVIVNINYPPIAYDSLSYHQPFIDEMRSRGAFNYYESPTNILEHRSNGFPKLYEALLGGIGRASPLVEKFVPVFVMLGLAAVIYIFTLHVGKPNFISIFFAVFSPFFLLQFISDYTDGFLTLVFLGALYLVTATSPSPIRFTAAGVLVGALLSIKFSAPVFIVALLAMLFLYHRTTLLRHLVFLAGGGIIGATPILAQWSTNPLTVYSFGVYSSSAPVSFSEYLYTAISSAPSTFLSSPNQTLFLGIILGLPFLIGFWYFSPIIRGKHDGIKLLLQWVVVATLGGILFASLGALRSYSFLRYALPCVAIACIAAGVSVDYYLRRQFLHARSKIACFILFLLAGSGFIFLENYSLARQNATTNFDVLLHELRTIPTNSRVFFVNTGNPIFYGVPFSYVRDFSSVTENFLLSCHFLRSSGFTHVVVFSPNSPAPLGRANEYARQDILRGSCGLPDSNAHNWMFIYTIGDASP